MLRAIQLSGYRAFARLKLDGLQRVTLIVGKNNTGKTSVLEAAEVLAFGGTISSLVRLMERRSERIPESENQRGVSQLDPSHLFHGHTTKLGAEFTISGSNGANVGVHCSIVPRDIPNPETVTENDEQVLFDPEAFSKNLPWEELFIDHEPPRDLKVSNISAGKAVTLPISHEGGLWFQAGSRFRTIEAQASGSPVLIIPTEGMSLRTLGSLWNSIALTPDEGAVIDALKIIEPSLSRLAYLQGEGNQQYVRRFTEGFFATLDGVSSRVPFGSMGDGMKRLLALAMAVSRAAGGFLLVDEIDTGLHYSTLPDMWKLVVQTAQQLNVQVIATTHSGDCVRSLAWLHESAPELAKDVTLHRIERGMTDSVPFSAAELTIGSQQHVEFR